LKKIGITTTIPSEVVFASGNIPVDLNNILITSDRRGEFIKKAEHDGYPRNVCGWIKGIYGVLASSREIEKVIAVTQGDCSNTHSLMETLQLIGIETIPFAYPFERDKESIAKEIEKLADILGTTVESAEDVRSEMEKTRVMLDTLDDMTWKENIITGAENHLWLVSSSDFNGDYIDFGNKLAEFIDKDRERKPFKDKIRLAFIGVPPILDDIYDIMEKMGARVVFNEVQRQFSMPVRSGSIIEQYREYTYPYSIFHRLDYIIPELGKRKIDGVIHYVQSFCHRHIEDLVIRKKINLPVLTIEGENPGPVDERTKIRIQAFIEMLG